MNSETDHVLAHRPALGTPRPAARRALQHRRPPAGSQSWPASQGRLHRRRRQADLRPTRRAGAPHGGGAARERPQTRGTCAAADAGHHRLAGQLPRRDIRRPGAGGRQHAADRRRLRLHAGAFTRPGGAGVGRAAAGAGGGDGQVRPRGAAGDRLAALGASPWRAFGGLAAATGRSGIRGLRRCPGSVDQAGRHPRRRPGLLALFVGLDRPAQGHGAFPRQPLLDMRAVRQGRAGADRGRRLLFGRQAVFCLWPGQRAHLSDERGCHHLVDARTAHARRGVQALAGPGRKRSAPPGGYGPPPRGGFSGLGRPGAAAGAPPPRGGIGGFGQPGAAEADGLLRRTHRLCRHAGLTQPAFGQ